VALTAVEKLFMRHTHSAGTHAWIAIFALLVVAVIPQPVAAQSLFQTIFGFLGPNKQAAPAPVNRDQGLRQANPFQSGAPRQSYAPRPTGRLRTVCVRLCDGYYFPISNSSSRRDFYKDAQACQSRCQSDSRLYYMSSSQPLIKHARDRRGFAYKDLKTAFLYRKKLSKSCTCKPEPWTVAERMRHNSYALPQPQMIAEMTEPKAHQEEGTGVIAAQPQLVSQRYRIAAPAPRIAIPRPPAPRMVPRRIRAPRPPQPTRVSRRTVKKPNMGLGASFGLPKVKYRHRWSNGSN
jgi:hypothetical protein